MKLINGDCLEYLKQIPDKSIDMILQDPPYNTTACKWEWDIMTKIDEFWKEWNRIIKPNGAIVMFGSEPFSSALRMSNIKQYKYDWIWEKSDPSGFMNARVKPIASIENISIFGNFKLNPQSFGTHTYNPQGLLEYNKIVNSKRNKLHENSSARPGLSEKHLQKYTNYPKQILKFNNDKKDKFHPTQKPVALIEYLIKTYTNEGEIVFDGFMGSGTCGVACKNLNRDFIGIELDEKYFEIAKNRINNI